MRVVAVKLRTFWVSGEEASDFVQVRIDAAGDSKVEEAIANLLAETTNATPLLQATPADE